MPGGKRRIRDGTDAAIPISLRPWQIGCIVSRPNRPFLVSDSPLGFAHRGGAALFPENTLPAFQHALELGCRYLETDVHLSRDGVIVVAHDERVDRTTDGSGRVSEMTLAELRRFDAGYRFSPDGRKYPWRAKGLVIPTFEELLELSSDARINVELKSPDPHLVRAFWELVERRRLHERLLVAGGIDKVVRAFRKLSAGSVATSAGMREAQLFWGVSRLGLSSRLPVAYDALQVPPSSGGLTVVEPRFVRAAHARGIQVHVWTIDQPHEMRRLLDLGVDGIMSDRPDLMMQVLRERAG